MHVLSGLRRRRLVRYRHRRRAGPLGRQSRTCGPGRRPLRRDHRISQRPSAHVDPRGLPATEPTRLVTCSTSRAPTFVRLLHRYNRVPCMAMLSGMTSRPAQSTLRHGRVTESGRIYLVTFVTWNRAPIFRDYRHARTASRIIHARKTWKGAECLAWVLMPDHFHGLIRLDDRDLSKVVASARSRLTRALRKEGRTYPLWQRAFQDRALREDEDVRAAARYIVANPVRAGLAEHVCLYPYWNAIWL